MLETMLQTDITDFIPEPLRTENLELDTSSETSRDGRFWIVLRPKPNRKENAIVEQLHRLGIQTYLPTVLSKPRVSRGRKNPPAEAPLWQGYVFAWVDDTQRAVIDDALTHPHALKALVATILHVSDSAALTEKFRADTRETLQRKNERTRLPSNIGRTVRITNESFQGFTGIIVNQKNHSDGSTIYGVDVSVMGRTITVEFDECDVEFVSEIDSAPLSYEGGAPK